MKKESKSLGLFKIIFVLLILFAVATWIVPSGSYANGPFVDLGILRTSIYDFFMTYCYEIFNSLSETVFMLCVGGFYGVLSKSREYATIVKNVSKKIEGKENLFLIIIGILMTLFTSINMHFLVPLIFVPFIINVLANNGVNKFKTFAVTFGAIMMGVLGCTYGTYYANDILQIFPMLLTDALVWKFLALGLGYFILISFVLTKADGPNYETTDMYPVVEVNKKVGIKFVSVVLAIFALLVVFIYIPWNDAFSVSIFSKTYDNAMNYSIGNHPILSYLLNDDSSAYLYGSAGGYGVLFHSVIIMILVSFIISRKAKISINSYITNFTSGVKKMLKPVAIFIMVNCICVLAYWSPIGTTVVNAMAPAGSSFNVWIVILMAIALAIINVDYSFTIYSVGTYLSTLYAANVVDTVFIFNTMTGLVQFIFPTSYLLFFALSFMDISYKEYLKYMWKFLLALTIAMIFVVLMAVYI